MHIQRHARFYSIEICLALNYLHEPGIIYRDFRLDIESSVFVDRAMILREYKSRRRRVRSVKPKSQFFFVFYS